MFGAIGLLAKLDVSSIKVVISSFSPYFETWRLRDVACRLLRNIYVTDRALTYMNTIYDEVTVGIDYFDTMVLAELLDEPQLAMFELLGRDASYKILSDMSTYLSTLISDPYKTFVNRFFELFDENPEIFHVTKKVIVSRPLGPQNLDGNTFMYRNIITIPDDGLDGFVEISYETLRNTLYSNRAYTSDVIITGLFPIDKPEPLPQETPTKKQIFDKIKDFSGISVPNAYRFKVTLARQYDFLNMYQFVFPTKPDMMYRDFTLDNDINTTVTNLINNGDPFVGGASVFTFTSYKNVQVTNRLYYIIGK
jgi:hypothetical protein